MYFQWIYFWFKISWAKNRCIKPRSKATFLCNFQCETVTNKHSCQMYRTAFFLHAMAPSYGSNQGSRNNFLTNVPRIPNFQKKIKTLIVLYSVTIWLKNSSIKWLSLDFFLFNLRNNSSVLLNITYKAYKWLNFHMPYSLDIWF